MAQVEQAVINLESKVETLVSVLPSFASKSMPKKVANNVGMGM